MELMNCPNCDALFVQTKFRDVCEVCYKEEEAQFDQVYEFIRKKKNRTATMEQVVEETGVEEMLIVKFIKTGKLRLSQFPNLGVPCEKCGKPTRAGKLCDACSKDLRSELNQFEKEEKERLEREERLRQNTYLSKGR
ncbi:TIGR03826 family flagellar region protein [Bacillus massiliglaciei]|uniref:TIGR03826 family flagellar region protein n=1 Tax=Bacillus massiliglaciei TaxID=1816693 RepID=UPI000DA63639|nr:TIGR03826 family flagellar region protein [Bacillus massiliglaciei]